MDKKTFTKNFSVPFYDQDADSTWEGLPAESDIDVFKHDGCALCALAMMKGKTPVSLVNGGIACTKTSPYINNWLGLTDEYPDSIPVRLAEMILLEAAPAIIEVPGHYVVACGFYGTLSTDPEGNPYVTEATAGMIKIKDPYQGRFTTLASLEGNYGDASNIKY